MPSGRTHDRITLWTLPVLAGVTLAIARNSAITLIICAGFLFGGLMFGPDLDVLSVHYKRWGWLRWIWIPYRGSVKHRSVWSHGPVIGTTVRVIYLSVWLTVLGLLGLTLVNEVLRVGLTWEGVGRSLQQAFQQYTVEWLWFCLGLELGALSHYAADWGISTRKRHKTEGWKALFPVRSKTSKRKSSTQRSPTRRR
ncbi:MAG: metal-binding protein [Leptolyngbyaceae cyanobacterium RM2_2_4]|nr:metal-binding protein [Leptolyngbyaceae cyanobacterium SM1_4_3]NJO52979.1 metal-binding protein [Leptolyngbyaceae cyanobacterium RM2_2_4]